MAQTRHTPYKLISLRSETALLFKAMAKTTGLYQSDLLMLLLEKYRISKLIKK